MSDSEDFLAGLEEIARTAIMTQYVNIPCYDIDKYKEIADKENVKLIIGNVHISNENRMADTVAVCGNMSNISKFIKEVECERVKVHKKKIGW